MKKNMNTLLIYYILYKKSNTLLNISSSNSTTKHQRLLVPGCWMISLVDMNGNSMLSKTTRQSGMLI